MENLLHKVRILISFTAIALGFSASCAIELLGHEGFLVEGIFSCIVAIICIRLISKLYSLHSFLIREGDKWEPDV